MTEAVSRPSSESTRLAELDRSERRQHGITYTPDPLAAYVLDQLFGPGHGPSAPTLDPACGTGVFLRAMIGRLADDLSAAGYDIVVRDREHFLTLIEQRVWGLDRDEVAVHVALRDVRALVLALSPGPLDTHFLRRNLVVGDFLAQEPDLPPVSLSHMVGNPPYVAIDRIPDDVKDDYRQRFTSAFGRFDLYTLFMEQATRLLRPEGSWSFVTPDKYLSSKSARPLRHLLLASGSIRAVTLFQSHRVFADVATVPCVSLWVGSTVESSVSIASAEATADEPVDVRLRGSLDRVSFAEGGWNARGRQHGSLVERIRQAPGLLAEHTTRISAGLATGLNSAFALGAADAAQIEPDLVHPAVRGRDIRAFEIEARDEFLLIPYTWSGDAAGSLVDIGDFPLARAWLSEHRSRLEARHCVRRWGKQWWDLHDPVNLPLHSTPKILVPDVARHNRFALDEGRFVPHHSAYYLLPCSEITPEHLVTILNSSAIELLMRTSAPLVKDGFIRYRRQFLAALPMPDPQTARAHLGPGLPTAQGRESADESVSAMFGVDHGAVVEAVLATRNGSR